MSLAPTTINALILKKQKTICVEEDQPQHCYEDKKRLNLWVNISTASNSLNGSLNPTSFSGIRDKVDYVAQAGLETL